MLGRQAKTISQPTLRRMLAYARCTRTPKRDQVIVLLSVNAGLRACEIAALKWPMVLDATGAVGDVIEIRAAIAKRHSVPAHTDAPAAQADPILSEFPSMRGLIGRLGRLIPSGRRPSAHDSKRKRSRNGSCFGEPSDRGRRCGT